MNTVQKHSLHYPKTRERKFNLGLLNLYDTHFKAVFSVKYFRTPYQLFYYTSFKNQDILSFTEYYNLMIKKILLAIHHKISTSLYMSNHIISNLVWINFMPPFSSVQRNCFYSIFELTELWGGGGWEEYECQYCVSFKL